MATKYYIDENPNFSGSSYHTSSSWDTTRNASSSAGISYGNLYIETDLKTIRRSFLWFQNSLLLKNPNKATLTISGYNGNGVSMQFIIVGNNSTLNSDLSSSSHSNISWIPYSGVITLPNGGFYGLNIPLNEAGINNINGGPFSFSIVAINDYNNVAPSRRLFLYINIEASQCSLNIEYNSASQVNGKSVASINGVFPNNPTNIKASFINNSLFKDTKSPSDILGFSGQRADFSPSNLVFWSSPSYDLFGILDYYILIRQGGSWIGTFGIGQFPPGGGEYGLGLSPNTEYTCYIYSQDSAGNQSNLIDPIYITTYNPRENISNARLNSPCVSMSSVWKDMYDNLIYDSENWGSVWTGTFYQYTTYDGSRAGGDIYGYNTVDVSSGVYTGGYLTWSTCYPG